MRDTNKKGRNYRKTVRDKDAFRYLSVCTVYETIRSIVAVRVKKFDWHFGCDTICDWYIKC